MTITLPSLGSSPQSSNRVAATWLMVAGFLSLAPFPILGPAIGWPGSLSGPASAQLQGILAAPGAVQAGYGVYLLYSVLLLPVMAVAAGRLIGGYSRTWMAVVLGFAALSVLSRCIGILRWLTVMPDLAVGYAEADAEGRAAIEMLFVALNRYGGGVGELLGVSLFMGLSVLTLVIGAWRAKAVPGWLTGMGLISGLLLLAVFLPALGIAVNPPIALAVTGLHIWMWSLAGWLLMQARRQNPG